MRLVAVLLPVTLFFLQPTHAHESRPAYLELKETAPGQFSVLWRTPLLAGMRLPVLLKLPEDARNVKEPAVQQLTDSLVERRWIDAGSDGLAGKRIEFPGLQLTITDVLVRIRLLDGRTLQTIARPSQPWAEIAASQSWWQVSGDYFRLGVEHILGGIDHLLFVLGLLLIVRGRWLLMIKTVTAFTVAHSITLAMATLGFVHVPQAPVEAVIALSILFLATELAKQHGAQQGLTERYPWLVAFTFGLLHGFGFAGALSEVGLPQTDIPLALLMFNVGVEAGQLLFIGAVLVILQLGKRIIDRSITWVPQAAAYGIGSIAAFWVIQRVSGF